MIVNDYSAELVVAGTFAAHGWNVYFPHRDKGFDFIITKDIAGTGELIRPVQVKGKYPTEDKTDEPVYGYVGKLTKLHPEMVLAMPFYNGDLMLPEFIAYLPISMIKECSRGYRCQLASFKNGEPMKRPGFDKFFDFNGLAILEDAIGKTYYYESTVHDCAESEEITHGYERQKHKPVSDRRRPQRVH